MTDETDPKFDRLPMSDSPSTSPDIYLNGVAIGLTLSDIRITAVVDGQQQCQLHMSFTTAKTLATELSRAIRHFERLTERDIMTMTEVEKGMEKAHNK